MKDLTPGWPKELGLNKSGSNSAVECNLAKVEVEGSNPFSRSITFNDGIRVANTSDKRVYLDRKGGMWYYINKHVIQQEKDFC